MGFETLEIQREGQVAILTLSRPERMNALDARMLAELPRAWAMLEADADVWVVILTGKGDRAFCAGMDLKDPPPAPPPGGERARISPLDCAFMKPVICAVNGVVAGGGLALVPDSDIVIASESAYFVDTRTSVGQLSVYGTLSMLRKMPLEAVFRMAFLGRAERLDAKRAQALGLVSEVVPAAELLPRARALAETIAENSPSAVFATKRALMAGLDRGLKDALEEAWKTVRSFAREHPDTLEGARAFTEKRKPNWARPAK
jgi:(E)-benzylidenesuccinyl-CoA hydratase